MEKSSKPYLNVLQSSSLRELIERVNSINSNSDNPILKEDIVTIMNVNETFVMLYYK